jgi:hypothetical protein
VSQTYVLFNDLVDNKLVFVDPVILFLFLVLLIILFQFFILELFHYALCLFRFHHSLSIFYFDALVDAYYSSGELLYLVSPTRSAVPISPRDVYSYAFISS